MLTIQEIISRIAECAERNDHTEALLIAAKVFSLDRVKDQLAQIARDQSRRGYLTPAANYDRHLLYEKIMRVAKRQLAPVLYEKFHGAF